MAQEPVKIKEHIEAEREQLGRDFEEIEHRMKTAADWRYWYERNTVAMLGAAAAGGFLLANYLGRNSTPRSLSNRSSVWKTPQMRRIGETLDNTLSALIGVGTAKLRDAVSEVVPGFQEHFNEAQHSRSRAI